MIHTEIDFRKGRSLTLICSIALLLVLLFYLYRQEYEECYDLFLCYIMQNRKNQDNKKVLFMFYISKFIFYFVFHIQSEM